MTRPIRAGDVVALRDDADGRRTWARLRSERFELGETFVVTAVNQNVAGIEGTRSKRRTSVYTRVLKLVREAGDPS